jgi:phage tail-like protein
VTGWLVSQLPRAVAADPVVSGFVSAFEEVADSVSERVDGIEAQVDVGLASPEMLQFLASWLGLELEPTDPGDYQQSLVRQAGRLLGWRGTRYGVEGMLAAATGSRVTVSDGGGIFGQDDRVPPVDPVVTVRIDHTGHLTERQVYRFLEAELPVGAEIALEVRFPAAADESPTDRAGGSRPDGGGSDGD